MKGKLNLLCCPAHAALILALACGGSGEPPAVTEVHRPPTVNDSTTSLVPLTGITITDAPPDTVHLRWSGSGPARVARLVAEPGTELSGGDTVMVLEDLLIDVEAQRMEMELQVASAWSAGHPTDPVARDRADSLADFLDSLRATSLVPLKSPVGGLLLSVDMEPGTTVPPGTALATLSVGPESLLVAMPPGGTTITLWPVAAGTLDLVEPTGPGAVYYGVPAADGSDFADLYVVGRSALYEDGLRTFLVSVDGDTLESSRAGSSGGDVIVFLPEGAAGMEVRTWGN